MVFGLCKISTLPLRSLASSVPLVHHSKNRRDRENAKEAQRVSNEDQSLEVSYIPKRTITIREVRSVVVRRSIELLDPAFLHS